MTPTQHWWQQTTIYQIYPRSFADSDDDGIGDLRGIISKLDYIRDLGFETIWLSPFFSSPQQDWGYDISDYYTAAPEYGDLADIEMLIDQIHQRDMRVLFDLVMNHTSIEHPWFQESRSNRDNPRRDWYIWRDGAGNRPPNNWKAVPGGPGWHHDPLTDQWYYASFLPFQPDLNYRNPAVKEAMFNAARYWLDKGVDGFRLDIFHAIYKDARFRDNPFALRYAPAGDASAGFFQEWKYSLNQPETFELARELRTVVDTYSPPRMLIGEVFGDDRAVKRYLGEQIDGLNLVFLWKLLGLRMNAPFLREVIRHYETHYPAPYTPVYVVGNHDRRRVMTTIVNDIRLARLLALFQFTVRGVPVTYYGEEIGMLDGAFAAKQALDPLGRRYAWAPECLLNALGLYVNRDGCRTPMQWDGTANAGFCKTATPWLPVHETYKTVNVESESLDEKSLLNTYRTLLHLRRSNSALREGSLELADASGTGKNILAYHRHHKNGAAVVAINLGHRAATYCNSSPCRQVLFTIGIEHVPEPNTIVLPPRSGVILGE
jgi:alpha-glucosidase